MAPANIPRLPALLTGYRCAGRARTGEERGVSLTLGIPNTCPYLWSRLLSRIRSPCRSGCCVASGSRRRDRLPRGEHDHENKVRGDSRHVCAWTVRFSQRRERSCRSRDEGARGQWDLARMRVGDRVGQTQQPQPVLPVEQQTGFRSRDRHPGGIQDPGDLLTGDRQGNTCGGRTTRCYADDELPRQVRVQVEQYRSVEPPHLLRVVRLREARDWEANTELHRRGHGHPMLVPDERQSHGSVRVGLRSRTHNRGHEAEPPDTRPFPAFPRRLRIPPLSSSSSRRGRDRQAGGNAGEPTIRRRCTQCPSCARDDPGTGGAGRIRIRARCRPFTPVNRAPAEPFLPKRG